MDWDLLIKATAAFAFVLGLMFLFSWFLRRLGLAGPMYVAAQGQKRLRIVEHIAVDHRRRLVLVRRDGREHLLLLGATGETVIEKDIVTETAAGAVHDAS
jgi:flagellar protein FliO/FliZ